MVNSFYPGLIMKPNLGYIIIIYNFTGLFSFEETHIFDIMYPPIKKSMTDNYLQRIRRDIPNFPIAQ